MENIGILPVIIIGRIMVWGPEAEVCCWNWGGIPRGRVITIWPCWAIAFMGLVCWDPALGMDILGWDTKVGLCWAKDASGTGTVGKFSLVGPWGGGPPVCWIGFGPPAPGGLIVICVTWGCWVWLGCRAIRGCCWFCWGWGMAEASEVKPPLLGICPAVLAGLSSWASRPVKCRLWLKRCQIL